MQIRSFWVDIEDSSGTRLGRGPLLASQWTQTEGLSSSGRFSFRVLNDPNTEGVLQEKRVAVCKYVDVRGDVQTFGGGVIDKITITFDDNGAVALLVEGNDLSRELTYRSVGTLDLSGTGGAGVADAPTQIMALAPAGWSITGGTTQANIYAGFDGESVLNALIRCGEHIGEHWRMGTGRVIEWLGPSSVFAPSGVRAVQHVHSPVAVETLETIAVITSLEEQSDAADLISRVIPRGSGNGGAALTLAAVTDSAPTGYTVDRSANWVRRDATETTYGRIERALDFKDIGPISNSTPDVQAAANMLMQASVEHLRRYGEPQRFFRLGLANLSELVQPGSTIRVVYRKLAYDSVRYDLDGTFIVLEVQKEINASSAFTSSILVSTIDRMPLSDAGFVAREAMQGRVLSAHQQLGVSVDTLTFRDEMDDAHGADFRFWLGDEYTSIQSALLRFRIQPLRSTVKSVAGLSITTNAGGGGTSASGGGGTSGSGGSSTPTSASHTGVTDSSTVNSVPSSHAHGLNAHSHSVSISDHTHSIGSHTHTIDDHTHEIEPEILMVYGIFEESGANTLALSDLVLKLNNGADLAGSISDIGNGWYELDLTDDLTDEVFRPAQENNEIEITTATEKTARIEAQITIRGVVQAVAYL